MRTVTTNAVNTTLANSALEARQHITRSGMSDLYKVGDCGAWHTIKIARPEITGAEHSLRKEASAYQIIGPHPHIMPYRGSGTYRDQFFVQLDYLDEQHFVTDDDKHRWTKPTVVRIAHALAGALSYIHERNYLHLDVKPDNIWLGNVPMLFDFGLAQPVNTKNLSQTLILTPSYALPNRLMGNACTFNDDLFALGLTLYYWSTGHDPFEFAMTWDWDNANFSEYFQRWIDEHDCMRDAIDQGHHSKPFRQLLKGLLLYSGAQPFVTGTDVANYLTRSFPNT